MSSYQLDWEFRTEEGEFAPVELPAPWQRAHPEHHGAGEYRARFSFEEALPLYLRFEAVACVAKVFLNDVEVGGHTGSWTPFVADLTPALKRGEQNELRVEVDQKPSHTTAGFLPVIGAAFGGIWGPVT
ncbi:MAG: sugar-binding domain-containing protein, partial [Planctomycetota bacterium]